jgi:DNA-binding beta-propeller fold protein YncE
MDFVNVFGQQALVKGFARLSLLLLGAAWFPSLYGQSAGADGPVYREVKWPLEAQTARGTPSPWFFGEVAAVATTREGNIVVLHRGAHPIMEFAPTGKFLRSWGDGMISEGKVTRVEAQHRAPGTSGYAAVYGAAGCSACGAHSVRVDPQGNVWVVDATAHVIYKMSAPGARDFAARHQVILQLGTKGVSGADATHFNLPTDVAFAPNGDIYVSDGYGNARVVKYAPDGKYLSAWGKRGTGLGEFELPHNLAVDAQGRVYVTDRDNQRIQIFDAQGKFLDQWKDVGGVSTLLMTPNQQIWTGGVLRNLQGDIVARLPGNPGGHGTTVTESGDVFVAQLSRVVQKFAKE